MDRYYYEALWIPVFCLNQHCLFWFLNWKLFYFRFGVLRCLHIQQNWGLWVWKFNFIFRLILKLELVKPWKIFWFAYEQEENAMVALSVVARERRGLLVAEEWSRVCMGLVSSLLGCGNLYCVKQGWRMEKAAPPRLLLLLAVNAKGRRSVAPLLLRGGHRVWPPLQMSFVNHCRPDRRPPLLVWQVCRSCRKEGRISHRRQGRVKWRNEGKIGWVLMEAGNFFIFYFLFFKSWRIILKF